MTELKLTATVVLEGRMERGRHAILLDNVGVGTLLREKLEEMGVDLDWLYSQNVSARVTLEVTKIEPRPEPEYFHNVAIHRTPTYEQWRAQGKGWIEDGS